jgi:hypothetical protein
MPPSRSPHISSHASEPAYAVFASVSRGYTGESESALSSDCLRGRPWNGTGLSPDTACHTLLQRESGSFLVRESSRKPQHYVVDIRCRRTGGRSIRMESFIIVQDAETGTFFYEWAEAGLPSSGARVFSTIADCIQAFPLRTLDLATGLSSLKVADDQHVCEYDSAGKGRCVATATTPGLCVHHTCPRCAARKSSTAEACLRCLTAGIPARAQLTHIRTPVIPRPTRTTIQIADGERHDATQSPNSHEDETGHEYEYVDIRGLVPSNNVAPRGLLALNNGGGASSDSGRHPTNDRVGSCPRVPTSAVCERRCPDRARPTHQISNRKHQRRRTSSSG